MRTLRRIGLIVFAALLLPVLPASAQEDACFQKGGTWNPDEQRCILLTSLEIDIHYPLELTTEHAVIEQAVDAFIHDARSAFLAPLVESSFPVPVGAGPLALSIDYETFNFSEDVLSLKFTIYDYTGGAHGNTTFRTLTFDLAAGRELALGDLFQPGVDPLATVAPIVLADLQTQLGDMTDASWLEMGTAPVPENYANWVLAEDALIFFFPPYQVAAYAAGPQTVTIPLSDLTFVLALEFTPAP